MIAKLKNYCNLIWSIPITSWRIGSMNLFSDYWEINWRCNGWCSSCFNGSWSDSKIWKIDSRNVSTNCRNFQFWNRRLYKTVGWSWLPGLRGDPDGLVCDGLVWDGKVSVEFYGFFRLEDSLERNLTNQISKSLQAPLQTEMKKFHLVQQNSQLQVNQLFGQMRQLLVMWNPL